MDIRFKSKDIIELKIRSNKMIRVFKNEIGNNKLQILLSSIKQEKNICTISFFNIFALEIYEILKYFYYNECIFDVNKSAIKKAYMLLAEKTWIYNLTHNENIDDKLNYKKIKDNMVFNIMDHQKPLFDYANRMKHYLGYKGYILDASVGSGKTFMSLALSEALEVDKVIIVCPLPTLNRVWEDSIKNTLYKKEQTYTILKNNDYNNEKFILVHYEALNKLEKIIHTIKGKISIIVDEYHNFADPKSNRTILLKDIVEKSKSEDVILMSGTPIKATAKEVINIMEIIDPKFTGPAKERFVKLYKGLGYLLKHTLSIRYKALSLKITKESFSLPSLTTYEVKVKLKNSDKYLISNIKKDIKEYTRSRIDYFNKNMDRYIKLYKTLYQKAKELGLKEGIDENLYKDYEKEVEIIRDLYKKRRLMDEGERLEKVNNYEKTIILPYLFKEDKKNFKEAKTVYKYVALKIIGEALSNVIGKARENCHLDIVKEFDLRKIIDSTERKTLIFTKYISVGEETYNRLKKYSYTPLKVYGEYTKELTKSVKLFTEDKKYNPLITTYKSLSTGVPLVAANVMIAVDLPYRAYELEQTVARMLRIGQEKDCYFYYFTLDTDDEPNINNRNIDINKLNNEAVAEITGYKNQEYLDEKEEIEYDDLNLINNYIIYYSKDSYVMNFISKAVKYMDDWV